MSTPVSTSTHISQQYDNELEDLRSKVLSMGGIVEDHLVKVISSLSTTQFDDVEYVAKSDHLVNACEVEIDRMCTEILLRRTPAASDLRLVLAIFRTITDLERIGDETEKIARLVLNLKNPGAITIYYTGILAIANGVRRMLREALNAFARMDSKGAVEVSQIDKEIDDGIDVIMRQLITFTLEDASVISAVLDAVLAARALERIGDHSRNICENTIYLVEGIDVRHAEGESIEK